MVINDNVAIQTPQLPKADDVRALYKELWGDRKIGEKYESNTEYIELNGSLEPISLEEVFQRMKKIKANLASGLDNIKKLPLKKAGALQVITKIYNTLLTNEYYPERWKSNRTILIPKEGKDNSDIKNFKSITIGPILGRIFSGILDVRMRSQIKQTMRKKV